jgi:hypothetical protein
MSDKKNETMLHKIHYEACLLLANGINKYLINQGVKLPEPSVKLPEPTTMLPEDDKEDYKGYFLMENSNISFANFGDKHLKDCPFVLEGSVNLKHQSVMGLQTDAEAPVKEMKITFKTTIEYEIDGERYAIGVNEK